MNAVARECDPSIEVCHREALATAHPHHRETGKNILYQDEYCQVFQEGGKKFLTIEKYYTLGHTPKTVELNHIKYFIMKPHQRQVFKTRPAGFYNALQNTIWAYYYSPSKIINTMQIKISNNFIKSGFAVGPHYKRLVAILEENGIKEKK